MILKNSLDVESASGIVVNLRDITIHKEASGALMHSEEKYRKLAESTKAVLWEFDLVEDRWTYISPQIKNITGWRQEDWTDLAFWVEHLHPEDRGWASEYCQDCTLRGEPHEFEYRFMKPDGSFAWIRDSVVVEMAEGKPVKLRGFMMDITERKEMEDALRRSLQEKETLIREVHHRVKNNMQIISSLLNLQADQVEDEGALRLFRDAMARVRSMALVHEKLYRTESLASLEFSEFARDMVAQLFRSYGLDGSRVRVEMDMDEVMLGIDDAIPLALMLNELVSNSVQHAFPDGRRGAISITLKDEDGMVALKVADNGIGIPPGINPVDSTTLGLQLVNSLAGQLSGTMDIHNRDGTSFVFTFEKKPTEEECS